MRMRFMRSWCLIAVLVTGIVPMAVAQEGGAEAVATSPSPADGGAIATPVPAGNVASAPDVADEGGESGLTAVMGVTLIIWLGLFAYVYGLDRKVRRLEEP